MSKLSKKEGGGAKHLRLCGRGGTGGKHKYEVTVNKLTLFPVAFKKKLLYSVVKKDHIVVSLTPKNIVFCSRLRFLE